ncbi:MAG: AAA family ATPase [Planctomycetaceae bacterium]|nr:AAA family ATPase [Planctomycetaceae bacterium]
MRITDIMIDRYGVWSDLLLPVNNEGITLIHGPNEAGKSTLMRFVRGILYGFPAVGVSRDLSNDSGHSTGGSLRLTNGRQALEVTRTIDEHGRQLFRAAAGTKSYNEPEFAQLLEDVDAEVYRTIYTLGLKELRELSTLQSDQVGAQIYGSTLGLIGQRLLKAERKTKDLSRHLYDPDSSTGKLFDLSGEYHSVTQAIRKADRVMDRYQSQLDELKRLEQKQHHRRTRLQQLKREQGHHHYLQRVYTPWKRMQELERDRAKLPDLQDFPAHSASRLAELSADLDKARKTTKQLRQQKLGLKKEFEQHQGSRSLRDHASGVRALIDLRKLVDSAEKHLAAGSADVALLKSELDDKLSTMGSGWTINRLANIDCSPESQLRLSNSARTYQTALSRRSRHRRKYRRVSDAHHQRQTEWQDRLRRLGISSLDDAIKAAEKRIAELENVARLRVREAELEQHLRSSQELLDKTSLQRELPWWAQTTLTMFAMAGGFLVLAGLVRGIQTGWIIGLIYLLTGMMGGALAWALRAHFESDDHQLKRRIRREMEESERELLSLQRQLTHLYGQPQRNGANRTPLRAAERHAVHQSQGELVRQATQHLTDLQTLKRTEERLIKTRKTLSIQREKRAAHQKDVSATRSAWCDLLKQLGLPETVRTREATIHWQQALDAQQTWRQWQAAREDAKRSEDLLAQFREQMELVAGRISVKRVDGLSLSKTLDHWASHLNDFEHSYSKYQNARQELRQISRKLENAQAQEDRIRQEREALLQRAGVTTHEGFQQALVHYQRHQELNGLIVDLQDQLAALGREEPNLAIVEEDLRAYDASGNRERMEMFGLEIEDLERELAETQELIGRIRQTLTNLESDATEDDLKLQRQQIIDQAAATLSDYRAGEIAQSALQRMTAEFEERYQPATLARASEYLEKLTVGRYDQIRTPLGSRDLLIRERTGELRGVHQLSDGTREQLFLSIRLALIDTFSDEGIEMPVVFDDLFVNFDQERTEAAVETILDFAGGRQVLFFTCHAHLANMFTDRGVEPIWLPSISRQTTRQAG